MEHVGFPRTEKWPFRDRTNDVFKKNVQRGIVDLLDPSLADGIRDGIEVSLERTDEGDSLNVTLLRDNERAQELRLLRERMLLKTSSNAKLIDKDVLILYVDNLSRAHFHRAMPRTAKWLEKFHPSQNATYPESSSSFEFFRYNLSPALTENP